MNEDKLTYENFNNENDLNTSLAAKGALAVPRNLWLTSLQRRQELLSSARERVQNVLRHCMQTKPDSMLLRSYVVS